VLHYYFSDKEELLTECLRQYQAECVTRYDEIAAAAESATELRRQFSAAMAHTLATDGAIPWCNYFFAHAGCKCRATDTIARMLSAIGWLNTDGSPLTRDEASQATAGTYAALRWLGALPDDPCPVPRPTPEGVTFARAALRTWPSAG
jgi:AcrR family transcriptional regulator